MVEYEEIKYVNLNSIAKCFGVKGIELVRILISKGYLGVTERGSVIITDKGKESNRLFKLGGTIYVSWYFSDPLTDMIVSGQGLFKKEPWLKGDYRELYDSLEALTIKVKVC